MADMMDASQVDYSVAFLAAMMVDKMEYFVVDKKVDMMVDMMVEMME